ncbi:MAG TPA: hypothetical protein VML36_03430 [Nitrospiria bacterium]|nr:hypothetical protein [Nitrospiria bacterium]
MRTAGLRIGLLAAGTAGVLWLGLASPGRADVGLAPLLSVEVAEPGPRTSVDAAGPLFFYDHQPPLLQWGVRPLFSLVKNNALSTHEFDLLFPLLTERGRPEGVDVQLIQLIRWSSTRISGGSSIDWMVFPLLAYQGAQPNRPPGFALFPLYGLLHQFLGQTRLQFTLFPLWLSLERNQVIRHHVLWPFFGWASAASVTAPRVHGWQVWPFYGELIQEGVMEERFVLWPIYSHLRFGLNSTEPLDELNVLPFYASRRSPDEQSTTWLWPLFSHTVKPATHYSEWDLPWPVVRFGSGDDKSLRHVFPFYRDEWQIKTVTLFTKSERVRSTSRLILWPLYHAISDNGPDWYHTRTEILLLIYSDVRTKQPNAPEARRIALWPLFTYNKTPDGAVTFQTLAPIEPFLSTEPITRNYSPLWSLATFRHSPEGSEFSLLWGLIQWRDTKAVRQLRLFELLPLWSQKSVSPPPSTTEVAPSPGGPAGTAP